MSRRRAAEKRIVIPDHKFKDLVIAKFMNRIMLDGKKSISEKIIYGAFEKSTKGILLIDEVTEIPLETQSKILRVVIDQKFKSIICNHVIKVYFRIIFSGEI